MKLRDRRADDDIDDHLETLPDLGAEMIEIIESGQASQRLGQCLEKLSPSHRECLHLFFYEDCSVGEVASLVGVPEGTVKSRLYHARAAMKHCLELAVSFGRPHS